MSYNGSGTFVINTSGQPVVAGTVISSTAFNALTADLATGLSTAITKDGQTATTARIPFAAGISSTLVTDSTSTSTGSIITAGGVGIAKALYVGTTANIAGVLSTTSPNITTSITTPSTSFDLINATATTLNLGGAATAVNVGAATGTMTVANTTLAAKAITASTTLGVTGAATLSSTLTYGGVTLTNAVTGTGKMVLDTSPTLVTPTLGAASATSITVAAGTAALPAITTTGDLNTGIFFPAADTIAFSEGGAEAMRIDSSGNVGIGTSSPAQKLHIEQTSAAASLTQLVLQNADNTAGTGSAIGFANHTSSGLLTGKLESAIDGSNAYSLRFYTYQSGLNERMRIDSSGNLLVGTTTQIGAEQVGISFADASKNGLGIQVQASTSGAAFAVFRNSSGTLIGSITRNTTTNAVLYNTSSDYRLKENVTPLTNALARVSALKPVQWLWKDCDGVVGEGFIAHEVQDVVPAAVSGEKDAVDGEGNIKPQGMDASYLVATLTAAIQEQQALITALTARITALEN